MKTYEEKLEEIKKALLEADIECEEYSFYRAYDESETSEYKDCLTVVIPFEKVMDGDDIEDADYLDVEHELKIMIRSLGLMCDCEVQQDGEEFTVWDLG